MPGCPGASKQPVPRCKGQGRAAGSCCVSRQGLRTLPAQWLRPCHGKAIARLQPPQSRHAVASLKALACLLLTCGVNSRREGETDMRVGLKSSTAAAVMALMIGCWATLAIANECTGCTQPNGRGIYVVDNAHYCITSNMNGRKMVSRFCPEAFLEVSDAAGLSRVELAGSFFAGAPSTLLEVEPSPRLRVTAIYKGKHVPLVGVETKSPNSRLIFFYDKSPAEPRAVLKGADLANLTLEITVPTIKLAPSSTYLLNFKEEPTHPSSLPRYTVTWRPKANAAGESRALCTGPTNIMSLLPGKRVNGRSGKVMDQANATTLSCESGAIIPCMKWGYTPSQLNYTDAEENRLLGACIQAKRAAYFAKSGDYGSYTVNGMAINMKDHLPIPGYTPVKNESFALLEAIWTEDGAKCLNPQYRRKPTVSLPNDPLPVPTCGSTTLPNNWAEQGIMATGRRLLIPPLPILQK